eukprot:867103-Pleurochrysis_carterae.AAC.1
MGRSWTDGQLGCLRGETVVCVVSSFIILDDQPTRAHTDRVPSLHRGSTETPPQSAISSQYMSNLRASHPLWKRTLFIFFRWAYAPCRDIFVCPQQSQKNHEDTPQAKGHDVDIKALGTLVQYCDAHSNITNQLRCFKI